jgi:hypothetical protein
MKQLLFKTTIISAFAIATLAGCKKENLDTDTTIALDNSIADGAFQDMMGVVSEQATNEGLSGFTIGTIHAKIADDCPTVTFSEALGVFPNTMTLDFGTSCVGYMGVERSGKIIATFTGYYKDAGTVITLTTDNYYVNGSKVEGTKTVINEGLTIEGHPWFSVIVDGGLITLETGETISWNSSRMREWMSGYDTPELEDDVYGLNDGVAAEYAITGVNRNGTPFTAHIAQTLVKRMDCRYITSGILEVTPEDMTTRSLDFGDGDCDNKATLTVCEFSAEITLLY